ncbi:MAG TPA: TIGR04282 family arsenosugar biosynthesis glycosyltransferase [Ktedonobacteraceae bacterium]|nr:TIGR04282 family arsenosugar biosynthesis glycosyltransferase [Ktedonobacteraceae bacterium]
MHDTALVVMARYPEVGKTKTRLARTIGHIEAVNLYQAFLTDLAQRFAGQEWNLHWTYTPAEVDYQRFITTLAPGLPMSSFPQQGPDLGARLRHVFQWTHFHGFEHTIVIGSDAPHISREIIARAKSALDKADVVLGPADDGGYYLIAMRKPYDVFSGIPMSTPVVATMTIEAAQRQGLTVHLLESLFDVDELPDLVRLAQLLAADATHAPVTAAHLTTMRSLYESNTCTFSTALNLHRADQPL